MCTSCLWSWFHGPLLYSFFKPNVYAEFHLTLCKSPQIGRAGMAQAERQELNPDLPCGWQKPITRAIAWCLLGCAWAGSWNWEWNPDAGGRCPDQHLLHWSQCLCPPPSQWHPFWGEYHYHVCVQQWLWVLMWHTLLHLLITIRSTSTGGLSVEHSPWGSWNYTHCVAKNRCTELWLGCLAHQNWLNEAINQHVKFARPWEAYQEKKNIMLPCQNIKEEKKNVQRLSFVHWFICSFICMTSVCLAPCQELPIKNNYIDMAFVFLVK